MFKRSGFFFGGLSSSFHGWLKSSSDIIWLMAYGLSFFGGLWFSFGLLWQISKKSFQQKSH